MDSGDAPILGLPAFILPQSQVQWIALRHFSLSTHIVACCECVPSQHLSSLRNVSSFLISVSIILRLMREFPCGFFIALLRNAFVRSCSMHHSHSKLFYAHKALRTFSRCEWKMCTKREHEIEKRNKNSTRTYIKEQKYPLTLNTYNKMAFH